MRAIGIGIGTPFMRRIGAGAPPAARIDFTGDPVAENVAAGAVLGALQVFNATGTPAYTLTDHDGNRVALSGANVVRGATALDFETHPIVTFSVSVSGMTPAPGTATFTIIVTDVVVEGDPTLALDLDFAAMTSLDPRVTFTRAGTATYYNSAGVLSTAATNVARFDHAPVTLAPRGLLLEEQCTNTALQSQDLMTWSGDRIVRTANTTVAPDGTTTADTLASDGTGGNHYIFQIVAGTGGQPRTWSVYMKAGTFNFGFIQAWDTSVSYAVTFNLLTGATGGVLGTVTAKSTSVGNGWWRCEITFTAAGANVYCYIGPTSTFSQTEPTAGSIYAWGAQLEAGSFATSYIPTAAAAVTRAADSAQMTGTNFSSWYVNGPGTVIADADSLPMTTANRLWDISLDGTYIDSTFVLTSYAPAPEMGIFAGGAYQFTTVLGVLPNVAKFGLAWASNDVAGCVNGAAPFTDTSVIISNRARLALGSYGGTSLFMNGWIKRWTYYNTRKSNAELQSLTAPSAPPAALDLNFTTGTLDPRVTFTRAGSATYYNSAGVFSTAATNVARFDHDPVTLAPRGLLLEEQRTNLYLYSQDFTPGNWPIYLSAVKVGPAPIADPAGTMTAYEISFGGNNQGMVYQTQVAPAPGTYTISFYVRAKAGSTTVRLNFGDDTIHRYSSDTTVTDTVWTRVVYTVATGAITGNGYVGIVNNAAGNSTNVYVAFAQLEIGSFATSYIPTAAAAVTRAADSASMTGTNFSSWHNATEGTFTLDFELAALSVNHLLNINATNDSERTILTGYGEAYIIDDGVVQMNVPTGTPGLVAANKMALAYKVNDAAASLNGSSPTTDSSCSINIMSQLAIGNGVVGGEIIPRMHARRLRFYNTRKTNAELQALTAP